MTERRPLLSLIGALVLVAGVAGLALPLLALGMAALPGSRGLGGAGTGALLLGSAAGALALALAQTALAAPAAAALALFRLPGRGLALAVLAAALVLPLAADGGGPRGTDAPPPGPSVAAAALAALLLWRVMAALPTPVIEAARLDGATPLAVMRRLVLPQAKATILALGLLLFLHGWGRLLAAGLAAAAPAPDPAALAGAALLAAFAPTLVLALAAETVLGGFARPGVLPWRP